MANQPRADNPHRSVRVEDDLWEAAKEAADQEGTTRGAECWRHRQAWSTLSAEPMLVPRLLHSLNASQPTSAGRSAYPDFPAPSGTLHANERAPLAEAGQDPREAR